MLAAVAARKGVSSLLLIGPLFSFDAEREGTASNGRQPWRALLLRKERGGASLEQIKRKKR